MDDRVGHPSLSRVREDDGAKFVPVEWFTHLLVLQDDGSKVGDELLVGWVRRLYDEACEYIAVNNGDLECLDRFDNGGFA